ncbi:MAG: tRNA (adenosine(37)-N6)-dimethylallyltransferase MiaA [Candidatus Puniceispirillaceae bacterium]
MDRKFHNEFDYIIVAGPTASGKSAMAIDLARAYDGVIINADSMQIYSDLSIITACPDDDERARAPHELYNILSGQNACSVGKWLSMARNMVLQVRAQNKLPILCGGTALYLNAARHGMSSIPDIPDELHHQIIDEHKQKGGQAMLDALARTDPALAARLSVGDSQRITRATEVFRHTGRPLSEWQNDPPCGQLPGTGFSFLLAPDRQALYERINKRFLAMWEGGAIEEVEALLAKNLESNLPVMKAVGVPQIKDYLAGIYDKQTAITEAQTQSRRYAKRQFTFFRNNFFTNFEVNETYSERKNLDFFSKIL